MVICQDQNGTDDHKGNRPQDRLREGPTVFVEFIDPKAEQTSVEDEVMDNVDFQGLASNGGP